MIDLLKNNPKLLWLAVIVAACTAITSVPSSVDFITDEGVRNTVKGIAGLVSLVSTLLGFKITPAPNPPSDK